MYLNLIISLREKESTDYNGWEHHVASLLKRQDLSFFPRNDAITLHEVRLKEEAENRAHVERVQKTAERLTELDTKFDSITEQLLEASRDQASKLQRQESRMQELHNLVASSIRT